MPDLTRVLITGATSQVGGFLLQRLATVVGARWAVSRGVVSGLREGVHWVQADIGQAEPLPEAEVLIHLAPLALLPPLLPGFFAQGGRRVIAFGTTSRFSKAASPDPGEQAYAGRLAAAEAEIKAQCQAAGAPWTLFRPTLIYGAGRDRNVALIANVIERLGVFPLLGEARGLRQPVHADDLACACVAALDNPASFNKVYDLCGGETLTYRDMVARIFDAHRKPPRFVRLPLGAFAAAMWVLARLPRYRDFNPEMARRMNQDLVFDCTAARRDLGFAPRLFSPTL